MNQEGLRSKSPPRHHTERIICKQQPVARRCLELCASAATNVRHSELREQYMMCNFPRGLDCLLQVSRTSSPGCSVFACLALVADTIQPSYSLCNQIQRKHSTASNSYLQHTTNAFCRQIASPGSGSSTFWVTLRRKPRGPLPGRPVQPSASPAAAADCEPRQSALPSLPAASSSQLHSSSWSAAVSWPMRPPAAASQLSQGCWGQPCCWPPAIT